MVAVSRGQSKHLNKSLKISAAVRSFLGHLEGTGKSSHTVSNYQTDLRVFERFLVLGGKSLQDVSRDDLERFHDHLKALGLKTNTRRRKLLTVRRLMRYLSQRKKIDIDVGNRLPTPAKIERVPLTLDLTDLIRRIHTLPSDSPITLRNQTLLLTLAETGCLVSEVIRLRFEDWDMERSGSCKVTVGGTKTVRQIAVSGELRDKLRQLQSGAGKSDSAAWCFLGFNRAGPLGSPISARGVELLVKSLIPALGLETAIHPKHFRHSAVLAWFKAGLTKNQIRERLGLRTEYAFRVFEPLIKPKT